jgi:hypothetical protein
MFGLKTNHLATLAPTDQQYGRFVKDLVGFLCSERIDDAVTTFST